MKKFVSALLIVVGAVWFILGVGNLWMMDWAALSEGWSLFGLLFNVVVFVLPSLLVLGMGALLRPNDSQGVEQSALRDDVYIKLKDLYTLYKSGTITKEEYWQMRKDILKLV